MLNSRSRVNKFSDLVRKGTVNGVLMIQPIGRERMK